MRISPEEKFYEFIEEDKRNRYGYHPFGTWKWRSYDGHHSADVDKFLQEGLDNDKAIMEEIAKWEEKAVDSSSEAVVNMSIAKIKALEAEKIKFYIGTDSQVHTRRKGSTIFSTVIIAYKQGRGGHIIMSKDKLPYMNKDMMRERLIMEAWRSLETAWAVVGKIPKESLVGIHLDVNSNGMHKSNMCLDEAVSLIMGQDFNALVKPNSWAASAVADAKC